MVLRIKDSETNKNISVLEVVEMEEEIIKVTHTHYDTPNCYTQSWTFIDRSEAVNKVLVESGFGPLGRYVEP